MTVETLSPSTPADPRFFKPKTMFFGIGAQKCGTTWLSDYLLGHPQVATPVWKEQNYWHVVAEGGGPGRNLEARRRQRQAMGPFFAALRDIGWTTAAKRNKGAGLALKAADNAGWPHKAYADAIFLRQSADHFRSAGEISPSYALLPAETFAEMAKLSDAPRFVFLMRDPVNRIVSGIRHALNKDYPDGSFGQQEFDAVIANVLTEADEHVAVQKSRYDLTIAALESVIPTDQIGYFFFETFFDQNEVNRLCRFLSISEHPAELEKVVHLGKGKTIQLRDEDRVRLATSLAPCYAALRTKFGSELPAAWAKSEALIVPEKIVNA